MKNDLIDARQTASRGAAVGAAILYAVVTLAVICELLHGLLLLGSKLPGTWGDPVFNALLATSQIAAAVATALLGRFLRHFVIDAEPFCPSQSARLIVAAALLMGRLLLDAALRCAFDAARLEPVPQLSALLVVQAALRVIALGTFLACLSMVVRYGDALKKDSDSIV